MPRYDVTTCHQSDDAELRFRRAMASRLLAARASAQLSAHGLATLSGVHKNTIYRIERGDGGLGAFNYFRLKWALRQCGVKF